MKCLLVFDHLNDVVYTKYDEKFANHIQEFASLQGFSKDFERIMSCQFGNSYTSIQCEDGLNLCFDEYMGYLFVSVAPEDVPSIKKFLSICITIVRYLCGPDVCQLKACEEKAAAATRLIDSWAYLQNSDQAVFVEAVEQLVVNSDISSVTLQILRKSVDQLISSTECSKIHAMVLRDVETLRPAFDNLDTAIKRLNDAFKKNKNSTIDYSAKQLLKKWDIIRKKYLDFIKTSSDEALLRAETLALGLLENLKQLLNLSSIDEKIIFSTQKQTLEVAKFVSDKLNSYNDFLKYLEEFPGLVHFLYIDRVSHRLTAPTLDFSADETNKLTKNKIWAMIKFSRNHLQEGNLSLMWKDTIFNYAYFLWFEDISGAPMKPVIFPTNSSKALPLPGLLGADFYQCYELFCVHLGLVTASCVLEHTRRLAATIWELRGLKAHPIDLL
ncbi:Hermansky-Pudlak syndrome 1 protein -like [Asbolus verrucosus]|uniref:Hermansky-Pudlak syndrome 1 protein-like n=1 Tax=Asbolus verrucosus TaxID=1661398 RepID=A0A482V095_ASBVE|nr:Hermansky-Pudlak syndrome 1 protein -like [Asbolus verrucosus]